MNKWFVFALIPLVLSIGIVPSLQPDILQNAEAAKAKGNSLTETNSKKVCGDRLCSEYVSKKSSTTGDSTAPGTVYIRTVFTV